MLKTRALELIAGVTPREYQQADAPTNLHVISGEVGETSEEGKALVRIDGLVFGPEDTQYVEVDTLGGLEEGDTTTILLTGEPGHGMTPLAIGSVGSIDRIRSRVSNAETSITQNAEAIALRATKTEVDLLDYRISDAEAMLIVQADLISSKVSRDGLISSINQSPETIKIAASKLELDGTTIFSLISNNVDDAITRGTDGLAGLSYDHTWTYANNTYTFTGYAMRGGVDISDSIDPEYWTWLLRTEDGDTQLPRGRTLTLNASVAGYRASVVGGLEELVAFELVDSSGDAIIYAGGDHVSVVKSIV